MVEDLCNLTDGAVYVATEFGTCVKEEDIMTDCRDIDYHCAECYDFTGDLTTASGELGASRHCLSCVGDYWVYDEELNECLPTVTDCPPADPGNNIKA